MLEIFIHDETTSISLQASDVEKGVVVLSAIDDTRKGEISCALNISDIEDALNYFKTLQRRAKT